MKKISALLIILMLTSALFSCGSTVETIDVPTKQLLDSAIALFSSDDTYDPSIYYSVAESGSDNYLDAGYMSMVFYGESDIDMPEMQYVDEYAMAIPSGLYAFEIDIIKAKSASDASKVKALLDKRTEIKMADRGEFVNYDASQLPVLDSCEVFTTGKYVVLLATPDNSGVKSEITKFLGGKEIKSDGTTAESSAASTDVNGDVINVQSSVNGNLTGAGSKDTAAPSNNPSELPVITVTSYSANNLVVLGGSCSEGAKIHVRGGTKDRVFGTDYNMWLCEVEIPTDGVTNLYVTQEETGKAESEAITVTVQARTDVNLASHGVCQVAIGDNAQGHFFGQIDDWTGGNILSDNQVSGVTSRIKDKVDYLAEKNCELIYVIVPNPMKIYPETVPERYVKSTKDTSRTQQFETAATTAGATVIDLTDILTKHSRDGFKIFHKTDSHWTDYGAFWGYTELMNYISKSWADAKALPLAGNFEFYHKEVIAGDMMTHLEIQNSLIKENDSFVKWLIDAVSNPDIYMNGKNEIDFSPVKNTNTVTNNLTDKKLPTAMVIRDSFSSNIYGYFNNAFSEVYWQSMWNYKFDKSYIEKTNPNYYIVLVAERNIGNILG